MSLRKCALLALVPSMLAVYPTICFAKLRVFILRKSSIVYPVAFGLSLMYNFFALRAAKR